MRVLSRQEMIRIAGGGSQAPTQSTDSKTGSTTMTCPAGTQAVVMIDSHQKVVVVTCVK